MPIRCFVAVEIEDGIRARLAEIQAELRASGAPVRWSPAENLHVTLKFLGDIDESAVGQACIIVQSVAADCGAFALEFTGLGAFPNLRRPRVVFVHAHDPSGALAQMAERLDREMTAVGVAPEGRPFRSHLTLGRMKGSSHMAALTRAMDRQTDPSYGRQTVEQIVLMRSELRPSGAVYSRLCTGECRAATG